MLGIDGAFIIAIIVKMYPYFNLATLTLYIVIGCVFAIFVRLYRKSSNNRYLIWAAIVLVVFSISRSVDYGLGGADAKSYEQDFLYCLTKNHGIEIEPLFLFFTQCIRRFTDNPIIYRLVCYSIIAFGYVSFIRNFCPKRSSSIPYVALILPFLLSFNKISVIYQNTFKLSLGHFNTMRSSMAASLILFGVVSLKKENWLWATILIVSSVFVHRMSILFIPFLLFYYIFKGGWIYRTKLRLVTTIVVFVCLSVIIAKFLQIYIALLGVLDGTDGSYLMLNEGKSFFSATPYVLPLMLLMGFILISSFERVYKEHALLTVIIIYDIIIYPASFILGMWRTNEFFYVARLTMWGILVYQFCQRFNYQERIFIRLIFFVGFITWTINRINAHWEDAALMPYVLNWF